MLDAKKQLESAIKNAQSLHGHLGPFLVIGVKAGLTAKRILNLDIRENNRLQVLVKIPVSTPFSCIIDGIQTTTKCTIGNQKLKIKNTQKEIMISFTLQGSAKVLSLRVNPKIIEELISKISKGILLERLAWDIAYMPENQLFTVEER